MSFYQIARVVKKVGFKGFFSIKIENYEKLDLNKVEFLFFYQNGQYMPFKIESIENQFPFFRTKLEKIDSEEQLVTILNQNIFLNQKDFENTNHKLSLESKYIDFEVWDNGKHIGKIINAQNNSGQILWTLYNEKSNNEFFIPCVNEWILEEFSEIKKINVNLPNGLY